MLKVLTSQLSFGLTRVAVVALVLRVLKVLRELFLEFKVLRDDRVGRV
jgi:hypothetical protein